VTASLIADVRDVLTRHGWSLDDAGHTALLCALWQLANRPGTTQVAPPPTDLTEGSQR
jgi:hypothetical protein